MAGTPTGVGRKPKKSLPPFRSNEWPKGRYFVVPLEQACQAKKGWMGGNVGWRGFASEVMAVVGCVG